MNFLFFFTFCKYYFITQNFSHIFQAVISNHVETVKFLLNDGVPASKKDCFGETALDFAIKLKRKEIINLLNIPVED